MARLAAGCRNGSLSFTWVPTHLVDQGWSPEQADILFVGGEGVLDGPWNSPSPMCGCTSSCSWCRNKVVERFEGHWPCQEEPPKNHIEGLSPINPVCQHTWVSRALYSSAAAAAAAIMLVRSWFSCWVVEVEAVLVLDQCWQEQNPKIIPFSRLQTRKIIMIMTCQLGPWIWIPTINSSSSGSCLPAQLPADSIELELE